MKINLFKEYKKIRNINISILVLSFFVVFFFVLWSILVSVNAPSLTKMNDGNKNSIQSFEYLFGGEQLIPFIFGVIVSVALVVLVIVNIIIVCVTNIARTQNPDHEKAKLLTWIGFGLMFLALPVGNIILIIASSMAMLAINDDSAQEKH
ncbi:hypothetical protein ACX1NA_01705 [Mycoplasma sp. VS276A1]